MEKEKRKLFEQISELTFERSLEKRIRLYNKLVRTQYIKDKIKSFEFGFLIGHLFSVLVFSTLAWVIKYGAG